MPVLDGSEASQMIRKMELQRQPYIIAVTAHVMSEERGNERDVRMYGLDAFVLCV